MFHGFSVRYCTGHPWLMVASVSTMGFHEHRVNEMCQDAGFARYGDFRSKPFNNLPHSVQISLRGVMKDRVMRSFRQAVHSPIVAEIVLTEPAVFRIVEQVPYCARVELLATLR